MLFLPLLQVLLVVFQQAILFRQFGLPIRQLPLLLPLLFLQFLYSFLQLPVLVHQLINAHPALLLPTLRPFLPHFPQIPQPGLVGEQLLDLVEVGSRGWERGGRAVGEERHAGGRAETVHAFDARNQRGDEVLVGVGGILRGAESGLAHGGKVRAFGIESIRGSFAIICQFTTKNRLIFKDLRHSLTIIWQSTFTNPISPKAKQTNGAKTSRPSQGCLSLPSPPFALRKGR